MQLEEAGCSFGSYEVKRYMRKDNQPTISHPTSHVIDPNLNVLEPLKTLLPVGDYVF